MKQANIISRVKEEIEKLEPGVEVYLFGSHARGDFRSDSDWDLLIISPREEITLDYELQLREPIFTIELQSGEVISTLIYSRKEWLLKKDHSQFFKNILKEGVRI